MLHVWIAEPNDKLTILQTVLGKPDPPSVTKQAESIIPASAKRCCQCGNAAAKPWPYFTLMGATSTENQMFYIAYACHGVAACKQKAIARVNETQKQFATTVAGGKARAGCTQCLKPVDKEMRCGRCKLVIYCSAACQKAHWPDHKGYCAAPPPAKKE